MSLILGAPDIKGDAEIIRHLLAYLNLPFKEVLTKSYGKMSQEEGLKLGIEFPNSPYLITDKNDTITSVPAIILFVCTRANKADLLGKSYDDIVKVRTLEGAFKDKEKTVLKMIFDKKNFSKEKLGHFVNTQMIPFYQWMDDFLGSRQWMLDYITIADFHFTNLVYLINVVLFSNGLEDPVYNHKRLCLFCDRFKLLPGIKEYLKSKTSKNPIFFSNHVPFQIDESRKDVVTKERQNLF